MKVELEEPSDPTRYVYWVEEYHKKSFKQDFFIKLGIKPRMHLLEIGIFFTLSRNRQTYQNYEQSRQKLGTFLENKVL